MIKTEEEYTFKAIPPLLLGKSSLKEKGEVRRQTKLLARVPRIPMRISVETGRERCEENGCEDFKGEFKKKKRKSYVISVTRFIWQF